MEIQKYIFYPVLLLVIISNNVYSNNKVPFSGTVEDIDGKRLQNVQITLKSQQKSVSTNRFGEFDFGRVFPNDTFEIKLLDYQKLEKGVKNNIKIRLYPISKIQTSINNLRNGQTLNIPSGIHYIYPNFNIDSTVGISLDNKSNITLIGNKNTEIRLKWINADIFRINQSNNITIKNITLAYAKDIVKTVNIDSVQKSESQNKILKIKSSNNISLNKINIYGNNKVCINLDNSNNISIIESSIYNGSYGFVLDSCENVKIENSNFNDLTTIIKKEKTIVELINNTIKIKGNHIPEFITVLGGSIEMLDESIIPPPIPTYLEAIDFKISRTEITFDQYDAFCKAENKILPDDSEWGRGDRPVINITYNDALSYCKWLSELIGKNIRLPNNIEWEYAARGGVKGGDDKVYSGGNSLEELSWCKFNSSNKTQPVGQKKENELGLFDMTGNVYEFTEGVVDSMIRLKGGSWANSGVGCNISDNTISKIDFWDDNIGFRCVEEILQID